MTMIVDYLLVKESIILIKKRKDLNICCFIKWINKTIGDYMTNEIRKWNYLKTNSEVWFCELKPKQIYKFFVPNWFEELNYQFHQVKAEIKLNVFSVGTQRLENNRVLRDMDNISLSLWRAFYDKWEKAPKSNLIEDRAILIELQRLNKDKKWAILSIKGVQGVKM